MEFNSWISQVVVTVLVLLTNVHVGYGQFKFTKYMQDYLLYENTEEGPLNYTLQTTGATGQVFYGNEVDVKDVFKVDQTTGAVSLVRRIDREDEPTIQVTFKAFDSSTSVTISRTITIAVRDINDNQPDFVSETMKVLLKEDAPVGTTVYADLRVTDVDYTNSVLNVTCDPSITSLPQYKDSCNKFKLNVIENSNKDWKGYVTLAEPVDYEVQPFYQIPIVAFDGLQIKAGSIEVTIVNVQDTPPRFIHAESVTVEEGIPAGKFLEYVEAVDGDAVNSRDIRYELAFVDQLVRLDPVSGNITTNVTFDRESPELIIGYIDLGIRAREVIDPVNMTLGNDASTTAYTTIRITVLDANDNSPEFTVTNFNISIAEDIPNDSPLPNVILTVSDPDLGSNALFQFELSNYNDEFRVSPPSGQGQTTASILVKNTNLIDYETGPRQYIFNVIARESNTVEQRSGQARIIVNILDVNDNLPQFNPPNYERSILETAPGGTIIVTVIATDPDSGNLGQSGIRFGLLGDGSGLFNIGLVSGQVTVANCATPGSGICIDYERKNRYDLTVTAKDADGTGQAVTSNLVIHINDVNDNKPLFATKNYISYIEELKTVPNPNVLVIATDPDTVGGPISYSLLDSTGKWQMNQVTGNVTAKQPILYTDAPGVNGSFVMTVQASDGKFVDTGTITIYVIDLNNNAPKFDISDYNERIDEKTPGNTYVLTVQAQDDDSPTSDAGKIDYSINTGAFGKFVIDSKSGNISTSADATFDFDVKNQYVMQVLARDRGRPQQTGTSTVTIDITDANNKDPYFIPSTMRAEVYENVAIGYSVLKVTSQDPDDNSVLRHFFVEPKSAINPDGVQVNRINYDYTDLFNVDQDGHVTTNSKLDRDKASVVTLTINVVDINAIPQQTGTGTVIINILEYNDQAPEFLPHTNITIDEERPIGTFVMALLAKDQDDAIAEYSLPYNPHNLFAIGFQTGVLSVASRIDFEKIEQTSFRALVYDTGVPRLSATTVVYVTVRNINDNSPIYTQTSYSGRIPEGSTPGVYVATVKATDADKGDYGVVRYEITDSRFLINDTTGDIVVAPGAVLDRETTTQIDIQVTAYDSPLDASVRKYTNVRVYISLDDINDNPPIFTQSKYVAMIIETVPVGIQVLQVFAFDADIGYNAEIAYKISNNTGDPDGLFGIAEKSGRVRVAKSLLRNSGVYSFIITAQDEDGNGPYTHTAFVEITVLEATNSPPRWIIPPDQNMTVPVLESQYLGMIVYDVHAEDPDRGSNGIIDYGFFVGGVFTNQTAEFHINSITGVISARIVYDREQVPRYTLLLMARDRGTPTALDATRYLTIRIIDVNDNMPKFPTLPDGSTRPIEFVIAETVKVGDPVGQPLVATDLDENPKIYYYIIGGDGVGKFALDKNTGRITVASSIDSEQQNEYFLDVHATNNVSDYSVITNRKKRALSPDIVRVQISVRNTNDAPPVFEKSSYTGCISTRAPIGQSIVTVYAKDQDSFGGVKYGIQSGNSLNGLQIGDNTGIIYNRVLMADFISAGINQFNLVVNATDNQLSDTTNVLIFVTQAGNEIELVVTQPPLEVRQFVDQIKTTFESLTNADGSQVFKFVCISAVKDHVTSAEQQDSYWSDVYLSAICENCFNRQYYIYSSAELLNVLNAQRSKNPEPFDLLYVRSMDVADDDPTYLDDTPAMIVMIIVAILFFLIILFVIIAAWCIWKSKQKSKKDLEHKRMVSRSQPDPLPPLNPMYDNRGFVPEESPRGFIADEPQEVQYAKVQKTFIDTRPQEPIPQPEITGPESIDAVIRDNEGDSDSSSSYSSPMSSPRQPIEEEVVDDFRIETEVVEK